MLQFVQTLVLSWRQLALMGGQLVRLLMSLLVGMLERQLLVGMLERQLLERQLLGRQLLVGILGRQIKSHMLLPSLKWLGLE